MADELKNVRRIQSQDRANLDIELTPKMLGHATEDKHLGFKTSTGDMVWYPAEDSDAQFESVTINNLTGTGTRNIGVDENGELVLLGSSMGEVDFLDFNPDLIPAPSYNEGRFFYDESEKTMRVYNDNPDFGVSLGQTQYARGKNETGSTIPKGTAVQFRNISGTNDGIQISIADAYEVANKSDEGWVFGVTTEDIIDDEYGSVAFYGSITGVDTSGLVAGQPAYLGPNGTIVSERPDYPAESVLMGTAVIVDSVNGVFQAFVERDNYDYEFDGCILEKQETNIVVDGTSVYLEVSNLGDPSRDLPIQLGGKILQLNTTTGSGTNGSARIELLQGTVDMPQEQIVYVYDNAGVATLGTSSAYPVPPFAIMSEISIRDVATVDAEGPDMDRRITSSKAHDSRGRISYLTERFAIESPKWWKGVTPTVTINTGPTPDEMNLSVIAGTVYQTHRQDFPALSVDTDGIYVANGPGGSSLTNYTKYNDLYDVLGWVSDSSEGRDTTARGNLVVFGVVNKDTSNCKLFVNLPSDLYGPAGGQADNCYFDVDNTADYTVPNELRFTAFLICRIPYLIQGNSISFSNPTGKPDIINLLGTPIGVQGGASGGGGTFIPPLTQVLAEGNDAGNVQIKNMANGTDDQDAVTKIQSEDYSDTKMEWKNTWVSGTYQENDVVRDGEWTMVANKETNGRPAPQPVGDTEGNFPVDPTFVEAQDDSVVHSGHTYTFTKSGWVKELKVYVTELTSNTNYRIVAVNNSTGSVTIINDPILTEDGFATVALGNTIVTAGTSFTVFVDALNSGTDTPLNGGWTAQGNTNNAPNTASWTKNTNNQKNITRLRFDKTDLDSVPRGTELLNAVQGSTILMTSGANNFTFVTNAAPVDGGSYVEYTGSVTDNNGDVTGTTTVAMDIPVPQDTKYAQEVDYWLSNQPSYATVQGYLAFDGVQQSVPNNAYGIDVIFQEASVSEDWDLLAFNGGSVSSGGGGGGAPSAGSDNFNVSDGAGAFRESIMSENTDGGVEIDNSSLAENDASFAVSRNNDEVLTVRGSTTSILEGNIDTLASRDATVTEALNVIGKSYHGGEAEAPVDLGGLINIVEGPSEDLYRFTSEPNPEPANDDYLDSGATQNGSPIYETATQSYYLFKMSVVGQLYWVINDTIVDGDVEWNNVLYRQSSGGLNPEDVSFDGLFSNGAQNVVGAMTLESESDIGIVSERGIRLNGTDGESKSLVLDGNANAGSANGGFLRMFRGDDGIRFFVGSDERPLMEMKKGSDQNILRLNNANDSDYWQYEFNRRVSGQDPIYDDEFATKAYADSITSSTVSTWDELKTACATNPTGVQSIYITGAINFVPGDPLIVASGITELHGGLVNFGTDGNIEGDRLDLHCQIRGTNLTIAGASVNCELVGDIDSTVALTVTGGVGGGTFRYERVYGSVTSGGGLGLVNEFWYNTNDSSGGGGTQDLQSVLDTGDTAEGEIVLTGITSGDSAELNGGVDGAPPSLTFKRSANNAYIYNDGAGLTIQSDLGGVTINSAKSSDDAQTITSADDNLTTVEAVEELQKLDSIQAPLTSGTVVVDCQAGKQDSFRFQQTTGQIIFTVANMPIGFFAMVDFSGFLGELIIFRDDNGDYIINDGRIDEGYFIISYPSTSKVKVSPATEWRNG